MFVGALKAVAPILVLMLVMASIANHQHGQKTNIRPILFLYLLGTFSAALAAVIFSFAFPSTLHLSSSAGDISPPSGIVEVMRGLVMSMVSNPIDALLKGNYIGILVWAIGLGFALRHGNETTKNLVNDMSNAVTFMVKLVIHFAQIGIFGLVIPVDLPTALLLSVVASLCACGASGVAGGSLLLIPLACNMFGISNDIAMQVVAVGFIIGVLQDSCETALNSSTDVLFTAAACQAEDDRLANSALRN